jgi:hypothetical protein
MLLRLRLLLATLLGSTALLLVLCLGSQNLNDRPGLRLGFAQLAPLPTGFLTGVALVLGVLSGGGTAALLAPGAEERED